uniref:Uncharacterized protein n=3 Tax=Ovis aries TaxID=9940 RepID=A0AC11E635_SHEEP
MGANNSSLTLLNCILKNWDRFDPQRLKKTHLVFLCDTAWPRIPLEDGERWPVGGSLKYNTVLQLDLFCKEQGKNDLKDRFLTQSVPDIHRKLQKWAYEPNQSLDTLLQLAQTVYYGREYEEKKERQRNTKEKAEAFAMAMKNFLKLPEKNAQRDPGEKILGQLNLRLLKPLSHNLPICFHNGTVWMSQKVKM